MIARFRGATRSVKALGNRSACFAATSGLLVLIAGCGDHRLDKAATQAAVKVNNEEITVHQVNFALQQRAYPGEQEAATRQVVEALIDQELAVQKAQQLKLERDANVVQQLDMARREIIARAYFQTLAAGASKPTSAEIKSYYDEHPALFKERRMYSFQELAIEAAPETLDSLQAKLNHSKDFSEFIAYLRANDIKFVLNQAARAAEQLPLASLDRFAHLMEGQSIFSPGPKGAQVVVLLSSKMQPIGLDQSIPAIEAFLLNERRRKLVEETIIALRTASKLEYVGDFAKEHVTLSNDLTPESSQILASAAQPQGNSEGQAYSTSRQDRKNSNTEFTLSLTSAAVEKEIKGFKY